MSSEKKIIRYSNAELEEFHAIIYQKLEKTNEAVQFIQEQIKALTEAGTEGDWMDDTTTGNDLKMLYTMEERHNKHIRDLQAALFRIKNKTYGICIATGVLIDKRRLMAVPTTTKSLEAKLTEANPPKIARPVETRKKKKDTKPKSIVKIVKKSSPKPPVDNNQKLDDDLDDDLDDLFVEDDFIDDDINFDLEVDDQI
jgi:RNA polymerase-binding protein DksA